MAFRCPVNTALHPDRRSSRIPALLYPPASDSVSTRKSPAPSSTGPFAALKLTSYAMGKSMSKAGVTAPVAVFTVEMATPMC